MAPTGKSLFCIIIILSLCNGCEQERGIQSAKADSADEPVREKRPNHTAKPVITDSARGWNLEINTLRKSSPAKRWIDDTILISPNGQRINVGDTGVPDIHRPILWVVNVHSLKARFLVLYLYPVASGGARLSLYLIQEDRIVSTAAKIGHHFEWDKEMAPRDVIGQLFKDIDGDGKPELVENDVGKTGGPIIYHEFVGTTFFPSWIEDYRPNMEYKMRRISRKSLKTKTK